ncbi:MAG: AraC family transcriptional regulator, partial [Desulfobacteraceae bacterium]|nr:AraC family transcriptional regulator [Desulfobacteraceae bacterium]
MNNNTQADEYFSRINKVIDYIEAHLENELSLDELAKVACFSKFHFHRIFHALIREPIFSFIQRLRLEKAAGQLLANHRTPVTRIALDCGFSSSQAFARSFKERFHMSATQWRQSQRSVYHRAKQPDFERPVPVLTRSDLNANSLLPQKEVGIQYFEPLCLAYVRYIGPYEGDAKLFENLFNTLYKWAAPRDLLPKQAPCMVVYHDSIDITEPDKLRISACIEVAEDTMVSGKIGKMHLAKGKYA